MNPHFKEQVTYALLLLTAHSWSEPNTDFTFKHNLSGFECEPKKVKGSFHFFVRSLSLMTVLAMDYLRLASIYFEFALLQSLLNRFKSRLGLSETISVNYNVICIPFKFVFGILPAIPHIKNEMQKDVRK
jgi:hypothetical protein